MGNRALDRQMAKVAPAERIAELEHENRVLRAQRDRELSHIVAREFAADLQAAGIHAPRRDQFGRDGHLEG